MNSLKSATEAQSGFTLIELMIVVAVVGVLAAVAIPVYQNYSVKAKVGSALSTVAGVKTAIAMCIQDRGGVLTDCTTTVPDAHIPAFTRTREVASVNVVDGILTLKFASGIAADIDNATITISPVMSPDRANQLWRNETSVTNAIARDIIMKNNPPS